MIVCCRSSSDKRKGQDKKFVKFEREVDQANQSSRDLKRLIGARMESEATTNEPTTTYGLLSNENFQRIKELKVHFNYTPQYQYVIILLLTIIHF